MYISVGPPHGISIIEIEIRTLCTIEHRANNIIFYFIPSHAHALPTVVTAILHRYYIMYIYIYIIYLCNVYILYSFPAGPGRDYTAGGYIDILYRTVRRRKTPSPLVVVYVIMLYAYLSCRTFCAYLHVLYRVSGRVVFLLCSIMYI